MSGAGAVNFVHPAFRARGVVLVVVLWTIMLLAISAATLGSSVAVEMSGTRNRIGLVQAEWAARGGLEYAVWWLRHGRQTYPGTDPPGHVPVGNIDVQIRIESVHGRVDINHADKQVISGVVRAVKQPGVRPSRIADAILDWRDPDDLLRAQGAEDDAYRQAGRPYLPANRPFRAVSELQRVLGVTPDLYRRLRSLVTLNSGRSRPNPFFSPPALRDALGTGAENSGLRSRTVRGLEGIPQQGPFAIRLAVQSLPAGVPSVWRAEIRGREGGAASSFALLSWGREWSPVGEAPRESDERIRP